MSNNRLPRNARDFRQALPVTAGRAKVVCMSGRRSRLDRSGKASSELRRRDVIVVEAGDVIPRDGTVIDGVALVDESAVTGESAPVIREPGGDRCAVTGGTIVLSDRLVVEIASTGQKGRGRPQMG
jgi:potassium-transporting ATPase ATP-binding subunit